MALKSIRNHLRRRAVNLRKGKMSGFTLLELLVVVAILAAIAGTATIALQDTDARASAAAHVAMMDELNKGIRTYRVLNRNELPNNWDSLLDNTGAILANADDEVLGIQDITTFALDATMVTALNDIGIENLRAVDPAADPDGEGDCSDLQGLINNRGNAVVAGNIFLSASANGCGVDYPVTGTPTVAIWSGGQERVLGSGAPELAFDAGTGALDAAGSTVDAKILMAVGAGPSSNLFDASSLGGLTSVPVYRHVAQDQYNRFIILFHIATIQDVAGTNTAVSVDQVSLAGVVDGAGDTKEEELGEWDGTRNTI
ncbi:MAG: prepilin-type N-terminal cleavage/methylation domain-containing protein [Sneathiellales bacterium]|nr:prepilin-type N-terminal cleavage/methylation domain-containing protein [Sneathiellales bacterium]